MISDRSRQKQTFHFEPVTNKFPSEMEPVAGIFNKLKIALAQCHYKDCLLLTCFKFKDCKNTYLVVAYIMLCSKTMVKAMSSHLLTNSWK